MIAGVGAASRRRSCGSSDQRVSYVCGGGFTRQVWDGSYIESALRLVVLHLRAGCGCGADGDEREQGVGHAR